MNLFGFLIELSTCDSAARCITESGLKSANTLFNDAFQLYQLFYAHNYYLNQIDSNNH